MHDRQFSRVISDAENGFVVVREDVVSEERCSFLHFHIEVLSRRRMQPETGKRLVLVFSGNGFELYPCGFSDHFRAHHARIRPAVILAAFYAGHGRQIFREQPCFRVFRQHVDVRLAFRGYHQDLLNLVFLISDEYLFYRVDADVFENARNRYLCTPFGIEFRTVDRRTDAFPDLVLEDDVVVGHGEGFGEQVGFSVKLVVAHAEAVLPVGKGRGVLLRDERPQTHVSLEGFGVHGMGEHDGRSHVFFVSSRGSM